MIILNKIGIQRIYFLGYEKSDESDGKSNGRNVKKRFSTIKQAERSPKREDSQEEVE